MTTITWKELLLAYEDCKKHKRSSYYCMLFEMFEYQELYKLYTEINSHTYEIGYSITFVVHYPKDREVFAAAFRDRIVHHLVIIRLKKGIESYLIDNAFSCRDGKGTLYGIKQMEADIISASENYTKKVYILSCDLKNFFMSVDKNVLMEILDELLTTVCKHDYELYSWLVNIIVYNRPQDKCIRKQSIRHWANLPREKSLFYCNGIPIGNHTSQNFANIYLTPADLFVLLYFVYYGRYADDAYVISDSAEHLKRFIPVFDNFLQSHLHIRLHPNKISIKNVDDTIKFLGAIIKKGHRVPLRRTLGHVKSRLRYFNEYHKNYGFTKDDLGYIFSCINSYLGFFRQFSSYRLRKRLVNSEDFQLILNYYDIYKYDKLTRKL